MDELTYPLAGQGVFRTIQGEGHLCGLPMVFIRLGGCSVGCPGCDTNYRAHEWPGLREIKHRASALVWGGLEWCWITGGEPTDHDIAPLVEAVRECGLKVALATAGVREVKRGLCQMGGVDFLSVSPHDVGKWNHRRGDQLNLVFGLNGLSPTDPALIAAVDGCWRNFNHCYATPMTDREGRVDRQSLELCRLWVDTRHGWKLGHQAHKGWNLP